MEESNSIISLSQAVEAIKTAILQGQYEAAKDVNRVQLAVYFSIGRYLSKNTRRLPYGAGALKAISEQLRKELPGLRGYSENNLKNMRKFYEAWNMLDYDKCNLNVTNALPPNEQSTIMIVEREKEPTIAIVNSQNTDNYIDIYHAMQVPDVSEFPVEDFFRVPFTHHVRMVEKAKNLQQRYYYIHRTAEEHLSVEALETYKTTSVWNPVIC